MLRIPFDSLALLVLCLCILIEMKTVKNYFTAAALSVLTMTAATAEDVKYEATWESLDKRETPSWYGEAKFGIFIHWGLYSVPAWAPKGEYAEWYWHSKDNQVGKRIKRQKATQNFHNRVYGEDFLYKDFRPMFTASMFDPKHWAKAFKQSGAKYVVLTSKHHDGYCLWPSKEASESFGMPWNSVDSGPGRDLVGELTDAVRAEGGVKMGLYYSIWDWFNPLWTEKMQTALQKGAGADPDGDNLTEEQKASGKAYEDSLQGLDNYVKQVMHPQLNELVDKYQPALLFSDGDWWMGYEKWQTLPFLARLFNEAPNKDEVIINDRWGRVRKKHGDYYTTEYGSGFDDPNILWEENRGIGHSFGYNKNETLTDYNTREEILFLLVDIVSRGGNFLLDVGPTADGRIPVIMEQRLKEVGDWMAVNGEAIYGTKRWKKVAQWGKGKVPVSKRGGYKTGFSIIQLTLEPKEGQATKEAWFTQKDDVVYAHLPVWPDGNTITLQDVSAVSAIELLGSDKPIEMRSNEGSLTIDLSAVNPTKISSGAPYVIKLTGAK